MATNTRTGRRPARTRAAAKPQTVEEDIDELEEVEEEIEETPKPAARRGRPARRTPVKKAPESELEDDEDDEEEPPAKAKRTAPKRKEIQFGTQWLVDLIKEKTGKDYKAYDIRVLLRKMAKNDEIDREVGTDRGRYEFDGPRDPVVLAIIKKVKAGAVADAKKASLDKLKESQKNKRAKAKADAEEDVEEEEVDELDDGDYEDEDDE